MKTLKFFIVVLAVSCILIGIYLYANPTSYSYANSLLPILLLTLSILLIINMRFRKA